MRHGNCGYFCENYRFLRQFITKLGMGLMLVVFLVGSTPPEYIHDIFVHHTEGVDPVLKKGETVMMSKHNHCSFLGFEFTPFISADKEYFVFEHISYAHSWDEAFYYFHFSATHKVVSLRGPPVVIA